MSIITHHPNEFDKDTIFQNMLVSRATRQIGMGKKILVLCGSEERKSSFEMWLRSLPYELSKQITVLTMEECQATQVKSEFPEEQLIVGDEYGECPRFAETIDERFIMLDGWKRSR